MSFQGNTPNPSRPRFNSCRSEPRSNSNNHSGHSGGLDSTAWISDAKNKKNSHNSLDHCPSTYCSTPTLTHGVTKNQNDSNDLLNNGTCSVEMKSRVNTPLENGTSDSYLTKLSSSTANVNGSSANITPIMNSLLTEKPPIISGTTGSVTTNTDERASPYRDQPASGASPPTRDKLRSEDKARRRMNQQGKRIITNNIGDSAVGSVENLGWRIRLNHYL